MPKAIDLTGEKIGKLLIIKKIPNIKGRTAWLCKCDCGNTCMRTTQILRRNTYSSCGCYIYDFAQSRKVYNDILDHGEYIEIFAKNKSILVDKEDYEKIKSYHWRTHKNYAVTATYKNGKLKNLWMHKLIMGKTKEGFDVDHINRNPLDNRKCNLRVIAHYQNKQNVKLNTNNSSGHRNISYSKKTGLFYASFTYLSKKYTVGSYKTLETALKKLKDKRKKVMSEEDYKIYENSLYI